MKKHDEGYALVLVLVVMIVISLVAATVLTFSLRNLQNQQKSIQRMEDKYEAQGKIEKEVQKIIAATDFVALGDSYVTASGTISDDKKTLSLTLKANSENNNVTVVCTVNIPSTEDIVTKTENSIDYYKLSVSADAKPEYTSYEITYQEVPE